jgi:hypothetical protein
MDFLYASGCRPNSSVAHAAASATSAAPLRWLFSKGCPYGVRSVSIAAARDGPLETLQFLAESPAAQRWSADLVTEMLQAAGAFGKLDTAKWLRSEHCAQWPAALQHSSRKWKGDCLQW